MATKKAKKVAGAPILQRQYNVKGIGALGHSHRGISPLTVNPKYGGSAKVTTSIIKSYSNT